MISTLRSPEAASTPVRTSSARAGSSPLVGSSSTNTGPGARRARATASRRRSPPDTVTLEAGRVLPEVPEVPEEREVPEVPEVPAQL